MLIYSRSISLSFLFPSLLFTFALTPGKLDCAQHNWPLESGFPGLWHGWKRCAWSLYKRESVCYASGVLLKFSTVLLVWLLSLTLMAAIHSHSVFCRNLALVSSAVMFTAALWAGVIIADVWHGAVKRCTAVRQRHPNVLWLRELDDASLKSSDTSFFVGFSKFTLIHLEHVDVDEGPSEWFYYNSFRLLIWNEMHLFSEMRLKPIIISLFL